ncbi:MAG: HD domain-containing phosphohydrolase [Thermaerobacterales bacterium]
MKKEMRDILQRRPVETVVLSNMTIQLLASGDGTEIIRHAIKPGARFGLRPEEGWGALECVFVVKGRLAWRQEAGDVVLAAGDYLGVVPVREPFIFKAMEDSELLYISSRPVFHAYSQDLRQLLDLAVSVEEKDGYTKAHCQRLQNLAALTAEVLTLPPSRMYLVLYGAFLHDVGKAAVPSEILGKPAALTPEEWVIMKRHPSLGREMVGNTYIHDAGPIIEQHHERLDGSGYPLGLTADAILLESQIVAVVDTYDAMTTDRPYRAALPVQHACRELEMYRDEHYSGQVVEALMTVLDKNPDL